MSRPVNGVRWSMLHGTYKCAECAEIILPGERMATWDDVTVGKAGPPRHDCTRRHYCEGCGELLEDSLTTTEMVR